MPLQVFDAMYLMQLGNEDKTKAIIVYGRNFSKYYDEEVAEKLKLRAHENVFVLKEGLSAWKKKGYPTEP